MARGVFMNMALARRLSALPCALLAVPSRRRQRSSKCDSSGASYYGSYRGDRFGGGIGERVGLDESRKLRLGDSGVTRVALLSETHEKLRAWATEVNWQEATKIHKAAYFTRSENLVQEEVLQRIRKHYEAGPGGYVAHVPVQAALFRLEDEAKFRGSWSSTAVRNMPRVVAGPFDERCERCVVDFANKRLGGGWLSYGMVQEEKMFIERFDFGALCARSLVEMPRDPLIEPVSNIFAMTPCEAWILRGAPAFAEIGWYGRTPKNAMGRFKLLDPAQDRDTMPVVVAIDAIKADFSEYSRAHLEMMLIKAYTGFVAACRDPDVGGQERIATGSWGCGAFYNNERVMFVIQALAANLAGVELTHHTLGDGLRLGPALLLMEAALVEKSTVVQVLDKLEQLCTTDAEWKSKYDPSKNRRARGGN